MAYDTTNHRMVLYEPGPVPQTWTWDGRTWAQQHPAHMPPSRVDAAMTADPSRGGVVLVGGTAQGDRSDVWAWDGTDWSLVVADQGPLFGAAHAVVASPKVKGSLLVIGNVGVYQLAGGAWSSLGVSWPATTGFVGNVAYAPGAQQAGFVRYGPGGETWTWLPGQDPTWVVRTPRCSPPGRWVNGERPALAYDEWREVVVLFGGLHGNDTWTFDGATWAPAVGGPTPPATPSPQATAGVGAWTRLPDMPTGLLDATATVLLDGRVLVAGGSQQSEFPLATVEIYDPKSNRWSQAPSMASPRARHTATLLRDGRVLVAGGLGPGRGTAEMYNPATNSWSPAGSLAQARANHQAALLGDGTVLVVGGRQPGKPLSSAEVYDPKTNSWSAVGALAVARDRPVAALLRDGRVLVTGGVSIDTGGSLDASVLFGSPLATSEVYDPATKVWTAAAPMSVGRVGHAMAMLPNGQVLVVGGTKDASPAEIYDPVAGAWASTTSLPPRIAPAVGVLGDGKVAVAGGLEEKYDPATVASTGYTPVLLASVILFDPVVHLWSEGAPLAVARWVATGSVLGDGRFLVCGGGNPPGAGSVATEAFSEARA